MSSDVSVESLQKQATLGSAFVRHRCCALRFIGRKLQLRELEYNLDSEKRRNHALQEQIKLCRRASSEAQARVEEVRYTSCTLRIRPAKVDPPGKCSRIAEATRFKPCVQEEEAITNSLLKRLSALSRDKEKLALQVAQDEELPHEQHPTHAPQHG
jgi:hypothetical protein